LPKHKTIEEEFGVINCGPKADRPKSMARLSMLFDVLNYTTIDGQIGSYDTSERALLKKHLEAVIPGRDLLLMDRGYPSLALMFQLQQQGIRFCIRMRDDWWKEVRKMLQNGENDKVVTFKLPKNEENKKLLAQYKTTDNRIKCRLIAINIQGSDTVEILCTSVINVKKLPYDCFESLYHYRWNIEEGIKLYKCRAQLEAFSGKTALAVKQDFYAKIFMMSTMAVLAFPIEEKIKKECDQSKRKHPCKINRTNALSMAREIICKIFFGEKKKQALKSFDTILESTTEIIRPKRKFPRNIIPKKPPSMNYKQL
ncbi:MAG: IS4 family transposase, partial [Rhabdochlamydiaceae bacterium]